MISFLIKVIIVFFLLSVALGLLGSVIGIGGNIGGVVLLILFLWWIFRRRG